MGLRRALIGRLRDVRKQRTLGEKLPDGWCNCAAIGGMRSTATGSPEAHNKEVSQARVRHIPGTVTGARILTSGCSEWARPLMRSPPLPIP